MNTPRSTQPDRPLAFLDSPFSPDTKRLDHLIRSRASIGPKVPVAIEALPRNPTRRDSFRRHACQVKIDGVPWAFVVIGLDLGATWKASCDFATECPEIASRPLFHEVTPDWEVVAFEWFDGVDIERLQREGRLRDEVFGRAIKRTLDALRQTRKPSTVEAAARELDAFATALVSSSIWSSFDRSVLRDLVLPFVRENILRATPETRWTNGDLVARNLLVAPDGDSCLIDYEFASRTHFHRSDLWRWKTFSRLPSSMLDLSEITSGRDGIVAPWEETLAILQHLVLAERVHHPADVAVEARERLPRVLELAETASSAGRASRFLRALRSRDPVQDETCGKRYVTAQLFWNATGAFNEMESARTTFRTDEEYLVRLCVPNATGHLELRLDPADAPGLLDILTLKVRCFTGLAESCLYEAVPPAGLLSTLHGITHISDTPHPVYLALNGDPALKLPPIDVSGPQPSDIVIEITMLHTPELDRLPDLIAHSDAAHRPSAVSPDRRESRHS